MEKGGVFSFQLILRILCIPVRNSDFGFVCAGFGEDKKRTAAEAAVLLRGIASSGSPVGQ